MCVLMMPLFAGISFLAIFAVASPGLPPTYLLMQAQESPQGVTGRPQTKFLELTKCTSGKDCRSETMSRKAREIFLPKNTCLW